MRKVLRLFPRAKRSLYWWTTLVDWAVPLIILTWGMKITSNSDIYTISTSLFPFIPCEDVVGCWGEDSNKRRSDQSKKGNDIVLPNTIYLFKSSMYIWSIRTLSSLFVEKWGKTNIRRYDLLRFQVPQRSKSVATVLAVFILLLCPISILEGLQHPVPNNL